MVRKFQMRRSALTLVVHSTLPSLMTLVRKLKPTQMLTVDVKMQNAWRTTGERRTVGVRIYASTPEVFSGKFILENVQPTLTAQHVFLVCLRNGGCHGDVVTRGCPVALSMRQPMVRVFQLCTIEKVWVKHNKSPSKTYDVVEPGISVYVVNMRDKAVTMRRKSTVQQSWESIYKTSSGIAEQYKNNLFLHSRKIILRTKAIHSNAINCLYNRMIWKMVLKSENIKCRNVSEKELTSNFAIETMIPCKMNQSTFWIFHLISSGWSELVGFSIAEGHGIRCPRNSCHFPSLSIFILSGIRNFRWRLVVAQVEWEGGGLGPPWNSSHFSLIYLGILSAIRNLWSMLILGIIHGSWLGHHWDFIWIRICLCNHLNVPIRTLGTNRCQVPIRTRCTHWLKIPIRALGTHWLKIPIKVLVTFWLNIDLRSCEILTVIVDSWCGCDGLQVQRLVSTILLSFRSRTGLFSFWFVLLPAT